MSQPARLRSSTPTSVDRRPAARRRGHRRRRLGREAPRSGSTPARSATASCSRSTATSPSSRCSKAPTASPDARPRRLHRQPDAHPRRRGLAGTGLQRPGRAARRRPAGARRANGARSAARPINPAPRMPPRDPILTGVSVVDGLDDTGARPEAADLLGRWPAPPRARRADRGPGHAPAASRSRVVFAAMGITHADADAGARRARGTRRRRASWPCSLNTADDPVVERIITPRVALTVAEHLAFDLGRHVSSSWPT